MKMWSTGQSPEFGTSERDRAVHRDPPRCDPGEVVAAQATVMDVVRRVAPDADPWPDSRLLDLGLDEYAISRIVDLLAPLTPRGIDARGGRARIRDLVAAVAGSG